VSVGRIAPIDNLIQSQIFHRLGLQIEFSHAVDTDKKGGRKNPASFVMIF